MITGSMYRDRERLQASVLEQFIEQITVAGDVDLPPEAEELRPRFDRRDESKDIVRDESCDLTVQERAALGEQIGHLYERVDTEAVSDIVYSTVRMNRRPTTVYLIVIASAMDPGELAVTAMDMAVAACAYFGKSVVVTLVINQVGPDIRYTIGRMSEVVPTIEVISAGEEYFCGSTPRRLEKVR